MKLTYDEVMDVLEIKHNSATSVGKTLPHGIDENTDGILMLKSTSR